MVKRAALRKAPSPASLIRFKPSIQNKNANLKGWRFVLSGKRDSSPRLRRGPPRAYNYPLDADASAPKGAAGSQVRTPVSKQKKNSNLKAAVLLLSGKRDSNSRPRPWQGRALPTELFPQIGTANVVRIFSPANFFTRQWQILSGSGRRFRNTREGP